MTFTPSHQNAQERLVSVDLPGHHFHSFYLFVSYSIAVLNFFSFFFFPALPSASCGIGVFGNGRKVHTRDIHKMKFYRGAA
jgi:hypothetical protein